MQEVVHIPIFPLSILPLPGEIVPLHIFEPRYRQLLEDIEEGEGKFGLLYSGINNRYQLGTILRLDRVLKRHPTGETDIVCQGDEVFLLLDYFKEFPGKMYPGGNVHMLDFEDFEISDKFDILFREYMDAKNQSDIEGPLMIHEVANELDLDINDRLRYLQILQREKRERFLIERVKFRKHVLDQESITRNFYIYN